MKKNNVYRIICFNEQFKVQCKMNTFWDDVRNALLSLVYGKGNYREFSSWETFNWIFNTIEDARTNIRERELIDESSNPLNWKAVE